MLSLTINELNLNLEPQVVSDSRVLSTTVLELEHEIGLSK